MSDDTPPGAEALMLARKIALGARGIIVSGEVNAIARALQQYGDERAREASALVCDVSNETMLVVRQVARAAAIEECATLVDGQEVLSEHAGMSAVENMNFLLETTAERIRALVSERGAEE